MNLSVQSSSEAQNRLRVHRDLLEVGINVPVEYLLSKLKMHKDNGKVTAESLRRFLRGRMKESDIEEFISCRHNIIERRAKPIPSGMINDRISGASSS